MAEPTRGADRSNFDPPLWSAVPPLCDADYTKQERDKARRVLKRRDQHNVSPLDFETGDFVFIKQANVGEAGYVLPLAVARVDVVSADTEGIPGRQARVTYFSGRSWTGKFAEILTKHKSNGKRRAGKRSGVSASWVDDISRVGVVLMRGGLTNSGKLNSKTLQHLRELPVAKFEGYKNEAATKATVKSKAKAKSVKKKKVKKQEHSEPESEEVETSEAGTASEEEVEEESDQSLDSDELEDAGPSKRAMAGPNSR